ncbi:tyrosine-protein kinase transmembrane modulator EpsC [Gracilibacillus boraciitolerans JCM 21714]|uniref:Tyrosine-protein kinase transmembrane modulator EpsC n=2 Tax=Gracilibacillus boraciitolerans TaxID=307521 RepID=W4VGP9_9BACI|nr:tyrosine-protein kinase transmembrane modulator EpsC [Gracilibacillus boraciitolerans JCM 21714]
MKIKNTGFTDIFKNKYWIILFCLLVIPLSGWHFYQQSDTPLYKASSRIIVDADINTISKLMDMITADPLLKEVVKELQLPYSSKKLSQNITAQSVDHSGIIRISIIDTKADRAALIANTTVKIIRSDLGKELGIQSIRLLDEAKE